ncbi:hypothetical protein GTR04_5623 [Trichophyton interdigitale]|nr:hypothetical protein GY631_1523 [Trichophyton interdigitale]KAG5218541.1 hypothetical protein GY632_5453 [Trichophyton interdigitale]KAG8206995.1 hypothetical protein GTR04_5623 [Trichophyton interdigitale]
MRSDTASSGSHAHQQAGREKAICTPHAGKTEEALLDGNRVDDGREIVSKDSPAGRAASGRRLVVSSGLPPCRRLVESKEAGDEGLTVKLVKMHVVVVVVVAVAVAVAGECQFAVAAKQET